MPAIAPLLSPELPELVLVDVAAEVELLVVVLDAQIDPRHWWKVPSWPAQSLGFVRLGWYWFKRGWEGRGYGREYAVLGLGGEGIRVTITCCVVAGCWG